MRLLRTISVVGLLLIPLRSAGQAPPPGEDVRRIDERIQSLQKEAEGLAGTARTLVGELRALEVERDLRAAEAAKAEAAARDAQRRAYAPYSRFRVGAAVRAAGEIFEGANIENASYPLAICAERTAVFAAVLSGAYRLEAVAVCTDASPPSSPCGACRQVLAEFAPAMRVILATTGGLRKATTLAELLPDPFLPENLR